MAITMADVLALLEPEEVNYARARSLGPEALPLLMQLVQGADLGLASKATYLASLIRTEEAVAVLEAAAARDEPLLRVAAASGIRNLPEVQAESVIDRLIADPDAGIRQEVIKSTTRFRSVEIETKIRRLAEQDPEPFVREAASNTVELIRQSRRLP